MTVIYAIILFVVLIFPHELGHFIVAKSVGVKVEEFAFGMGPAVFKRQKGETLYAIRAIPVGGYCAMEGENEESEDSRAFNNKPWYQKIAVLLAGSTMNILISILVLSIILGYAGSVTTTIDEAATGSPAYEAGIQKGDKILSIDGTKIDTWTDVSESMGKSKNAHQIVLERDGKSITVEAAPEKDADGRYIIGIKPEVTHNVFTAISNGAKSTWDMTKLMFTVLKQLITGEVSTKEMAGPVGIISMVNETTNYGFMYFGYLIALMSMNLAIINLLPLPALDGGRILFVIIRKLTGRMISDKLEGQIHSVGMVLLIGLMIFVTWNDVVRLLS